MFTVDSISVVKLMILRVIRVKRVAYWVCVCVSACAGMWWYVRACVHACVYRGGRLVLKESASSVSATIQFWSSWRTARGGINVRLCWVGGWQ
jgi:hypothetical protein